MLYRVVYLPPVGWFRFLGNFFCTKNKRILTIVPYRYGIFSFSSITEIAMTSSKRSAEDCLADGVRELFKMLPGQSALREPLMQVVLQHLSIAQVEELKVPVNVETLARYRNHEIDLEPLMLKRQKVEKVVMVEFNHKLSIAEKWLEDRCGVTASGRERTVWKSHLDMCKLYRKYKAHNDDAISINPFARLCREHHVHFSRGKVDTMTCVLCRGWEKQIRELEGKLSSASSKRAIRKVRKELDELLEKKQQHVTALVTQRKVWLSDLEDLLTNVSLGIIVVDYSTFELMDRKTTSVLGVCVIRSKGTSLHRVYFDFVDVRLAGRKRDGLFFAISSLVSQGVLDGLSRVRLWSDAGTSDFHNAPSVFSFLQLNALRTGMLYFESFSFFGARHGWNDVDRHFGNVKKAISSWMMSEATENTDLLLDVPRCAELLNNQKKCTAFLCTDVEIFGVLQESVRGLTRHYCFRATEDPTVVKACMYSSSMNGEEFVLNGKFVHAAEARMAANERKG